jgi:sigma-B regulation protein RsbU (phosphoserine phosphatase)
LVDDWFESAPCGLLLCADDGTILRVNRTFCAWIGRPADDLVERLRFQDLLTMGGRIFHQTHWSPLLRMQGSVSEVKLEIVHADGSKLPIVVNAVRREIDGNARHELAAFVARDRDRYEQELVKSRQRLEELVAETQELHAETRDRALFAEQMIGIVSHDLRNPLSAVAMGASILAESATESQLPIVHRIERATARAAQLINELLDFTAARVGEGIVITPNTFDLHASVAETLEELRLAYPGHTLAHAREGSGECVADDHRVAQVVGNLVSNAAVYGDREREITVTTRGGEPPTVIVHNWGPPIPTEKLATLFEPMTRGTQAGGKARSVGLGLYIVREIARAHGGAASAHSTPDGSTTFTVTFAPARANA